MSGTREKLMVHWDSTSAILHIVICPIIKYAVKVGDTCTTQFLGLISYNTYWWVPLQLAQQSVIIKCCLVNCLEVVTLNSVDMLVLGIFVLYFRMLFSIGSVSEAVILVLPFSLIFSFHSRVKVSEELEYYQLLF